MEQLLREALDPSVTPRQFFFDYLPRIHDAQKQDFARISSAPIILSFWFEDIDERYTIRVDADGVEVEEGEMVDFPVATIITSHERVDALRETILGAALSLDANRTALQDRYLMATPPVDAGVLDAFESVRGTIEAEVTGFDDGEPLWAKVVLNDYVPEQGAPSFSVSVDRDLVLKMASGDLDPRALSSSQVRVGGKLKLAMEIAGFASKHLKHLRR